MTDKKKPPKEEYKIRCPRLGHQIHFGYCRIENNGGPCFKTLDCWYPHFEVLEYLKKTLTAEEWEKAFGKPGKPKMLSLLELIEQAKRAKKKKAS